MFTFIAQNILEAVESYSKKASVWMSRLVKVNYAIDIDFDEYDVFHNCVKDTIDLTSSEPADLYKNILLLMNSSTDYVNSSLDQYNRFPYEASIQYEKGILTENVVHGLLERLLKHHGHTIQDKSSMMVISHDIDTLHNGYIHELRAALKGGRLGLLIKLLIAATLKKPLWYNLGVITEMLERYDFKSIFYFLVENGHSEDGIKNADYDLTSKKHSKLIKSLLKKGYDIGLHKSTLDTNYNQELSKLPRGSKPFNRNHYVKFLLPDHYRKLSQSSVILDSSLAYPYHLGFRNSYGLPFKPFDLETGETLDVLEVPFHFMGGKLDTSTKILKEKSLEKVIDFLEENRYNAVLGMLWHNTDLVEITNKYGVELFTDILKYLYESEFRVATPSEVLEEYSWG